ncbi:MAG: LON peptidase substrate-binding domain-containing protein, partial [Chloroflexaceae bacterium]|nr:LON peptidase substrate-binding domain-containing protein [Chloroflexaceae bacterium]
MLEEIPVLFNFPASGAPDPADNEPEEERELAVLPLSDTVLFPYMQAQLFLGEAAAISAVEAACAGNHTLLALACRSVQEGYASLDDLYTIGVEAQVERARRMPDGSTGVLLTGRRRMRVVGVLSDSPVLRVRAMPLVPVEEHSIAVEALMRGVLALFERVVRMSRSLPDDAYVTALNVNQAGGLADLIAATLPLSRATRQELLETLDPEERLHRVSALLSRELDVLELESRIQSQVQKEVDRSQRELYLREQLKVIQRELGQE